MADSRTCFDIHAAMSRSTLKAFLYVIYPIAIAGQILVVIDKSQAGIGNAGLWGIPNWVWLCCSVLAAGIFIRGMFTCRKALRSRSNN